MAVLMNYIHGKNKPGYDKIALFGLFIVALLTARLVVVFKSGLVFTKPIPLSRSGLSVSMPSGYGWQSEKKWKYQENLFTISSLFPLGSDRPTTWANCRYLLSADGITIDWARIYRPEFLFTVFYGTARLPDNRQLEIEVRHIASDDLFAKQTFKGILENLEFEDNKLLKAGAEIVTEIKSRGIAGFLDNRNTQAFVMIKDAAKRTIGFTMDVLVDSGTDTQLNIRSAGLFYIRGQNSFEQATSFQCSNNLNQFVYNSELSGRVARIGTKTTLDPAGVMTVRKFQTQFDEKTYHPGPAAIPDIFLDLLLLQMLESGKKEMIIDFIDASGKIIPTFISAIEATEDTVAQQSADDENTAYLFELELLDGRGFSEQIFLNNQKQAYKRLARQDNIYILERTDAESIAREFPEHAEYVLRSNRML